MSIPYLGITSPVFTISEKDMVKLMELSSKNEEVVVILSKIKGEGMNRLEEKRKRYREVNQITLP